VICPECATQGKRSIMLTRWFDDWVAMGCCRCLYNLEMYSRSAEAA
jgi:hypothetical protein